MKKNSALLILILACMVLIAQPKVLPIRILDATDRKWSATAPDLRTGTSFKIKVLIKTDKKIEFENVWLKDENMDFKTELLNEPNTRPFQKGDTVLINFSKTDNEFSPNAEKKKLPIRYYGIALLETKVDGDTRYFYVKYFRRILPK